MVGAFIVDISNSILIKIFIEIGKAYFYLIVTQLLGVLLLTILL